MKFKKGDVIKRKDKNRTREEVRVVTAVQDRVSFEYQLDGGSYWWSAASIEFHYEFSEIVNSPLWKALE